MIFLYYVLHFVTLKLNNMIDYCKNIPDFNNNEIIKYTNIKFQLGLWPPAPNKYYEDLNVITHICKHVVDMHRRECYCGYTFRFCNHICSNNICNICGHDDIKCDISPGNYNIMEKIISTTNIKK